MTINVLTAVVIFIITGILALVGKSIGTKVSKKVYDHQKDHKQISELGDEFNSISLLLLKGQILDIYLRAKNTGIDDFECDLANELFEKYSSKGGNGYMKTVITKINQMEEEKAV